MNKKSPILIIDGQNSAYAAYYSHIRLKSDNGKDISLIFGMCTILQSLAERFRPKKIYIVWDGKKNKRRLELLPNYKGHRKTKINPDFDAASFRTQLEEVRKLIKYLGIPQIQNPDGEADDEIFELVHELKVKYPRRAKIICSTDKDFLQLLTHKDVRIWHNFKKALITPLNITHKGYFPVAPSKVVDYLILTGDKSDDIPGYPGIGEKRAITFLSQFTSIAHFLSDASLKFGNMDKEKLKEIYIRNKFMIDLSELYNERYSDGETLGQFTYIGGKKNPKQDIESAEKFMMKYRIKKFRSDSFFKLFRKQSI